MQSTEQHRLPVYEAGDLRFDTQQQQVFLKGERIAIPGKSMSLLQVLMEQAPQVLSKDQLFELVWDGRAVSESVLTTAVKELRKALADTARSPVYIQTVHGRGYRFIPAVVQAGAAAPPEKNETQSSEPAPAVTSTAHPATVPRVGRSHQLVALLLVLAMAITAFFLATRTDNQAENRQLSVAVLPFDDLSPTQDQSWFAVGLTEEMVNKLARVPSIRVTSRRATLALIEQGLSPAEIATALDVDYLLEGSVRMGETQINISVHLIDTTNHSQVWAQSFDETRSDILVVQERIANSLADAMGVATDPESRARMIAMGTQSPAAYEAFLQALANEHAQWRTGQANFETQALAKYEQALTLDPNFYEAHSAAASIHLLKLMTLRIASRASATEYPNLREKYLYHVEEAIRLSSDDVQALTHEADKALLNLEYRKHVRLLSQLIDNRPDYARGLIFLSEAGLYVGDHSLTTATLIRLKTVTQSIVDRGDIPSSVPISLAVFAAKPQLGIEFAEIILAKFPEHAYALHAYHRALLATGAIDKARDLLPRVQVSGLPQINKDLASLRQACAEDDLKTAKAFMESIRNIANDTDITPPLWLAYMLVGQREDANMLLEPMNTADRLPQLAGFLSYPQFDPGKYDLLQEVLVRENIPMRAPSYPAYSCKID